MSELVLQKRMGGVQTLTLNATASRNALSFELLAQLVTAIENVPTDATGVVLTGNNSSFSAGADFRDLTGTDADIKFDEAVERAVAALAACPVPVIAAVEGSCMGAGAHLALSCDLRIAGDSSFLQVPAVRLGLLYSPESIAWLVRNYPRDTVRRLLLLGERFTADTAMSAGLFSRVVPAGTAVETAVSAFAGLNESALPALHATRELLGELDSQQPVVEAWQERRRELLNSPERASAIKKAHEKHGGSDA